MKIVIQASTLAWDISEVIKSILSHLPIENSRLRPFFKMATNKSIHLIKLDLSARIRLILCVKVNVLKMLNSTLNVPR